MNPAIAVLITYHNEGPLLRNCLESLARDADRPDEILVFDDASTVRPEPHVPSNLPVRIVRSDTNVGPAVGRNRLLFEARSEFIHFQDADDWFLPGWCAAVRQALSSGTVDAVFSEINSYRSGACVTSNILRLDRLKVNGDLLSYCLENPVLVPSGTYRTSLVRSMGGYDAAVWQSEDYDFHARLAMCHPSIAVLREPLIAVRRRDEGRSERRNEVWISTFQVIQKLAGLVDSAHQSILTEAAAAAAIALYRLGMRTQAEAALAWARGRGRPTYGRERLLYRWIAQLSSPFVAEQAAALYRRWLPASWRGSAHRWSNRWGFGSRRTSYF